MAELLGVVASGISVVQIAGQMVSCIQQLRAFCRSMRDLPDDLQRTLQELQILSEIFCQLETVSSRELQAASAGLLQISLLNCQAAASSLEGFVSKTKSTLSGKGKGRQLHLLRATLKKSEMKELKERLDTAKSLLHLAMTCYQMTMQQQHLVLLNQYLTPNVHPNSWVLEDMHPVVVAPSGPERFKSFDPERLLVDTSDKTMIQALSRGQPRVETFSRCATNKCYCSCHETASISGSFFSIRLSQPSSLLRACNRASCSNFKRASLWISLRKIGIPYAVIASLDMLWSSQNTFISPTLQIQRVVSWYSPTFKVLRDLRWNRIGWFEGREKITSLFDSGQASPRDVLPDGMTLAEKILTLPWPNGDTQLKLLEMLVNKGAPLNTAGLLYCCAQWNGLGTWKTGLDDKSPAHTHLLSKLLQLGLDPSEFDAVSLSNWPLECSPKPNGNSLDPFFVDWIASLIRVEPGFAGMNPFLEAILVESENEVKARFNKYSVEDQENLLEQSALHLAVSRPQHLQFLLDAGANPNARDCSGRTPLMYAAAAGSVDVAIALLHGGADPWMKDSLFGKEDFIRYAVRRDHWHLVMCALDYIRQSPRYSIQEVQSLMNAAIIRWAGENWNTRRSDYFKSLLNWGADPEILFTERWEFRQKERSNTLLHCITNSTDFDTLIASGFNYFNYSNSIGAHPLMKIVAISDAQLVRKCIEGGSLVNAQDHEGRSALHITLEELWESFLQVEHDQCGHRARAMDCAQVLLEAGAEPCLGDFCQCACSRLGCTPAHILLKEYYDFRKYTGTYPLAQYMWSFEWLYLLESTKGFESAKQCVLDMLRLAKFEQLELTHTCCRKYSYKKPWQAFGRSEAAEITNDVAEVMDEEAELIEELELQMKEIEHKLGLDSDLEKAWVDGLPQLLVPREQMNTNPESFHESRESTANITLMDHFQYLQRSQERPRDRVHIQRAEYPSRTNHLSEYFNWIEYDKMRAPTDMTVTISLFKRRKLWADKFLAMMENYGADAS